MALALTLILTLTLTATLTVSRAFAFTFAITLAITLARRTWMARGCLSAAAAALHPRRLRHTRGVRAPWDWPSPATP